MKITLNNSSVGWLLESGKPQQSSTHKKDLAIFI